MNNVRVAFFGTSDRSIPLLESLKDSFNLALCVTKRDVKVGRDQESKETGVKKWAKENNIRYVEVNSLKESDLEQVMKDLKTQKIEYGIVADFAFIIPEKLIEHFESKNLINIHFSLLPKYRGASPVQFAVLNGDENTGITFQLVNRRMDAGAILYQIGYKVTYKETSGELYETLFKVAADKLPKILEDYISGKLSPLPQDEEMATYTYSKNHPTHTFIYKEDAQINWKDNNEVIEKQVRAFNPWPISWTYIKELENNGNLPQKIKLKSHVDKNLKVKIYETDLIEGKIDIKKLQVEGKTKMDWKEFENGYVEK